MGIVSSSLRLKHTAKLIGLSLASLLLLLGIASIAPTGTATAQINLAIGSSSSLPNTNVEIPVHVDVGAEQPAVIFLDILYDTPGLSVVGVQEGPASIAAGKTVYYGTPSSGRLRVIIGGDNQNAISDGTVLQATFRLLESSDPGETLVLKGAAGSAADPAAERVSVSLENGKIDVLQPPPPVVHGTPVATVLALIVLTSAMILVGALNARKRARVLLVLSVLVALSSDALGTLVAGDIDLSGAVDSLDIQALVDYALGDSVQHSADVDFSGETDAVDFQLVVNATLGEAIDTDGDGLLDVAEANLGSEPNQTDTDEDGLSDGEEAILCGTDPTSDDSDGDGINDAVEVGADPYNAINTDGDDLIDALDPDSDNDSLEDGDEDTNHNGVVDADETDARRADTDGDGINDGQEIAEGTDPLVHEFGSEVTAGFAALPSSGTAPLEVRFLYHEPAKGHRVASWSWDFDNDGVPDSSDPDPTWVFESTGTYTVTLSIETNIGTTSQATQEDCVSVRDPLEGKVKDNVVCVDNEPDLSFVSMTDTELVLNYAGTDPNPISVDDVVVGTDQEGYARRVLAIDVAGQTLTLSTENASLGDIFAEADISGIVEFTRQDLSKMGIPVTRKGLGLLSFDDGVSFDGLELKGSVEFDPRLEFDARFDEVGEPYLRCAFVGQLNVSFDATMDISAGDGWQPDETSIFGLLDMSKPSKWSIFVVYGIPVVVVTEFDLLAGAQVVASAAVEVSAGFDSSSVVTFGAVYESGQWDNIAMFDLGATRNGPRFGRDDVSLNGQVYLKPKLSVKLYAITGPWAAGKLYLELDTVLSPPPASISLAAGVDLLLGFDLLDLGVFGIDFGVGYSPTPINCYSRTWGSWPLDVVASVRATPDFEADPMSGPAPLTVQFTDQSDPGSGTITARHWRFGDGTSSTVQNPVHTYTEPGTYGPLLWIEATSGAAEWCAVKWITVEEPQTPPTADFTAIPARGLAPLTVHFYDQSLPGTHPITEWAWDLDGDGEIDNDDQNPQWTYTEPGLYDIVLVVTTDAGTDAERRYRMIAVTSPGGGPVIPGEMISVPAGSFEMGDPWGEGNSDELPVHTVMLSAYEIGKYEVTNSEYADVLNWALAQAYLENSSGGVYNGGDVYTLGQSVLNIDWQFYRCAIGYNGGEFWVESRDGYSMENHPVVSVSWYGAVAYCNWLSEANGLEPCYNTSTWECDFSKNGYHLPTEAQWERAAAWNGSGHWRYGNSSDAISCSSANYVHGLTGPPDWGQDYCNPLGLSSLPYTSPVGHYTGSASPVGCYDMSGNVWEWCNDWFDLGYYSISPGTDPTGPGSGSHRVDRGGGWWFFAHECRTAIRHGAPPSGFDYGLGFRLAR